MISINQRSLNLKEQRLLEYMLRLSGVSKADVETQLAAVTGEEYDNTGSLILHSTHHVDDVEDDHVLSEARFPDVETVTETDAHVTVLLHARSGRLRMLEIFKEDGSPIVRYPAEERMPKS